LGALAAAAVVCVLGAIVGVSRISTEVQQKEAEKLSVPCPSCGAARGTACVGAQGQPEPLAPHGPRTAALARMKQRGREFAEFPP
jgi:hypothetical protein